MLNQPTDNEWTQIIEPHGHILDLKLKELWQYRDLIYLFVHRDFVAQYKQTILGVLWAVLQPVLTMVIFSVLFGRFAGMPSDGAPYPVFVFIGLLPWNYFARPAAFPLCSWRSIMVPMRCISA